MGKLKIFLMVLFFSLFAFLGGSAWAGPVFPGTVELTQPDGATFQAELWGDEFFSGGTTLDGYTVMQGTDGGWYYAEPGLKGSIVPGSVRADSDSPQGLQRGLRADKTFMSEVHKYIDDSSSRTASRVVNSIVDGTLALPVLLVEFPDCNHTFTPQEIQAAMFGESYTGEGNLTDYFNEISGGKLQVLDVGQWQTDWIMADEPKEYYGKPGGYVSSSDNLTRLNDLVRKSVQKMDDAGFDFSAYAINGEIPNLIVVDAGNDQSESGEANDIWARQYCLHYTGVPVFVDGVYIDGYTIQSEIMSKKYPQTVGTFAHELGHVLGWPDTYDITLSSKGTGNWDVMGYGAHNGLVVPGDCPAHPSPFLKTMLGWVEPQQSALDKDLVIANIENNPDEIYRLLDNPSGVDWLFNYFSGTGEYFLLENRQAVGFDKALPGTGLLIWHVNEAARQDSYANSVKEPLIMLEQADGNGDLQKKAGNNYGDAGDVFPGDALKTAFNANTVPDSLLYSGEASGVSLSNIRLDGELIRLTAGDAEEPADSFTIQIDNSTTEEADIASLVLTPKGQAQLAITVIDSDGQTVAGGKVTWKTGDKKIVKVSGKGKVVAAKKTGKTIIAVIYKDAKTGVVIEKSIPVTVIDAADDTALSMKKGGSSLE